MSLGVALVVIVILFFLIKSQGFRKAALAVVGISVVGGICLYLYFKFEESDRARKLAHARTLIQHDQIEIIDPRVSFSSFDGRPERINGRLRNNSDYTVRSVELNLRFEDCDAKGKCDTVGESDAEVTVMAPPGQSRDFSSSVYGDRIAVRGTRNWTYSINSITANVQ